MIEFIDEPGMISPETTSVALDTDVAVTTFSDHLFDILVHDFDARPLGIMPGCASLPLFVASVGGKRVIMYKSPVGAPAAVGALEVALASGIEHFRAFGICGALVDVPPRTLIVPERSYRDEGTSYHYLPPAESIALKNSGTVAEHLASRGVATIRGGAWTTDGFYRETRSRLEYMKSRGCVAVDMESSALQAACDFRGKEFYTFFISADSLAGDEWNPNYIMEEHHDRETVDVAAAHAAVDLAVKLAK